MTDEYVIQHRFGCKWYSRLWIYSLRCVLWAPFIKGRCVHWQVCSAAGQRRCWLLVAVWEKRACPVETGSGGSAEEHTDPATGDLQRHLPVFISWLVFLPRGLFLSTSLSMWFSGVTDGRKTTLPKLSRTNNLHHSFYVTHNATCTEGHHWRQFIW